MAVFPKSGALPPGVPFWVDFWALFLIIFEAQNDPQNEPKNDKNDARNVTEKTTYSKTLFLQDLSEIMALVFLKISEFLDTVDKLYISCFFVIHPCKPQTRQNISQKCGPKLCQNNNVLQDMNFEVVWESMALRFLKISEFLYTIDKLYISIFVRDPSLQAQKATKK